MLTVENVSCSNETWWGSWYSTAKSKSAEVYEAVRKDLGEISTAVKGEASAASSAIEKSLKLDEPDSTASHVKKSFSAFLGQMTTVLNPSPEDEDAEAILITADNGAVALSGIQKFLLELQLQDSTYLNPPEPAFHKQYTRWLEVIDDQLSEDRLSKHLASSQVLHDKYTNLVPDAVGHQDFWMRYLFRKALLEDGLAQAEAAERKSRMADVPIAPVSVPVSPTTVQPTSTMSLVKESVSVDEFPKSISNDSLSSHNQSQSLLNSEISSSISSLNIIDASRTQIDEEALKWEIEDFNCDVELTEEEQLRLLQEYEQEIADRADKIKKVAAKSENSNDTMSKSESTISMKVEKSQSPKKTASVENIKKPIQNSKQTKTNSSVTKANSNQKVTKSNEKTQKNNSTTKITKSTKGESTVKDDGALHIESDHFMDEKKESKISTKERFIGIHRK